MAFIWEKHAKSQNNFDFYESQKDNTIENKNKIESK
jgi:hypothetical protein